MNLFLTEATTSAAGGMTSTLVMLAMMMGIFYFMLIRPENKRKKEAEAMRSAVKVGDKIIAFNGVEVSDATELNYQKDKCGIGDTVTITVERDGAQLDLTIVLAAGTTA